jgi:hypothetical protein
LAHRFELNLTHGAQQQEQRTPALAALQIGLRRV